LAGGAAGGQTDPVANAAPFSHPVLLHGRADLDRIRRKVAAGEQPWKAGFEALRAHPQSRSDWKLRGPFAVVARGAPADRHNAEMVADANAAYQNALMWCVTGDEAHARKAVEVLDAWATTLERMEGRDVQLAAGLNGFKLVNADETIRYTYPGWPADRIARFAGLLRAVVYPPIRDFAPFANGNWDGACIKTMMATGVFCDDRAIFDRAVDYFRHGRGNGRLTHYVINEAGQCQERGRDQQHTQLGLGHLAEACEIAWHQGIDLYGEADNRLLKGCEYTRRYAHRAISAEGRGRLRPIYEMVWNHYENRRGVAAPFTRHAATRIRPEGAAFQTDHPGFGTLLFTRSGRPPGGVGEP
jgi:Alginate lyase